MNFWTELCYGNIYIFQYSNQCMTYQQTSIALYAMHKAGISKFKIDECGDFAKYLLREYHYLEKSKRRLLDPSFRFQDPSSRKRKTQAVKLIERLFDCGDGPLGITGNNGIEMGFVADLNSEMIIHSMGPINDPIYQLIYKSSKTFLKSRKVA